MPQPSLFVHESMGEHGRLLVSQSAKRNHQCYEALAFVRVIGFAGILATQS